MQLTPIALTQTYPVLGTLVGAGTFVVPSYINTIYLGPNAWIQGKLVFESTGPVRIYGPGVLDVSRFYYDYRLCDEASQYPEMGYAALAAPNGHRLENLALDGIVIADNNYYATDSLTSSKVNNVKVIGWNGNNDGLEFGANTTVTNVFVRSGDDSLKVWDSDVTVTNATVWQNYNGGVVNLGWLYNSPGENDLIDGLYVVKTDWFTPTAAERSWYVKDTDIVAHQNNAIIASMMVPGTGFGTTQTSTFENIYVEDPPQVLFSLKIVPPRDNANVLALKDPVILKNSSTLNLNIYVLLTPPSSVENSIGFDVLTPRSDLLAYPFGCEKITTTCDTPLQDFFFDYTLTGSMLINMTDVFIKMPDGSIQLLTNENAGTLGKISTRGPKVVVNYYPMIKPPSTPCEPETCN